jgi:hypothetical protein
MRATLTPREARAVLSVRPAFSAALLALADEAWVCVCVDGLLLGLLAS